MHFDGGDMNNARRLGAARPHRFSGELAEKRTDSRPYRSAMLSDYQRNRMRVAIVSAFPQLTKLKYKKRPKILAEVANFLSGRVR